MFVCFRAHFVCVFVLCYIVVVLLCLRFLCSRFMKVTGDLFLFFLSFFFLLLPSWQAYRSPSPHVVVVLLTNSFMFLSKNFGFFPPHCFGQSFHRLFFPNANSKLLFFHYPMQRKRTGARTSSFCLGVDTQLIRRGGKFGGRFNWPYFLLQLSFISTVITSCSVCEAHVVYSFLEDDTKNDEKSRNRTNSRTNLQLFFSYGTRTTKNKQTTASEN